jgi:uncharacterized Zn-finger protein
MEGQGPNHMNPNWAVSPQGTPDQTFPCDLCGKDFQRNDTMKRHKNISHTHTNQEAYKCDNCGKQLSCKSALKTHKETHKDIKYKCIQCTKSFSRTDTLNTHMAIHMGLHTQSAKRHTCQMWANGQMCSYGSDRPDHLAATNAHTQEKKTT